jgi:2,4-didehydro-3-deoxy-L-rhamnonate hydrolase
MKFGRIGERDHEIPVLIVEDRYFGIQEIVSELDGRAFESGALQVATAAYKNGELTEIALDGRRIGSPIARPGAIYCIGMNYAAHAAESGSEPPSTPILFLKSPNTISGPFDSVEIPKRSVKTDWEVELGVVIGSRALYLDSPADSASHIAGYVTVNDLSERTFQLEESGGQWSKGKSSPGFSPVGPWLVTPEDVSTTALRLRSWVNGEPRQDSTTADLIFDVDYLVWHLSQYLELEAGDLILTGTPAGVALSGRFPYLKAGDTVEVEIDGLGRQRQTFAQA